MRVNLTTALAGLITLAIASGFFEAVAAPYTAPPDADNFYRSDKLTMTPVTFPNQYKMEMSGDLFVPRDLDKKRKYPAIIVGHPMGAVKEQSAVLYAQKMAEMGFVTLAM
ncbi:MAG: alpha/beta hydrolase, partial [Desulfovibrio sp.]|nr:alpha/beta hydrolase [Desulfovibrio sp.]